MPAQFFNFSNDETCRFFTWVCESDPSELDSLINQAFEDALRNTEFENPHILLQVQERIAESLQEIIENRLPSLKYPKMQALSGKLAELAAEKIDYKQVAEALFLRKYPSQETPDVV